LDRFLTQPFHGAEPWSGLVGQLTPVAETIAGCRAILTGQYNALPEEAFAYVGALKEAVAKANTAA
jgi:F-type H+-transporting ATPase subunit beta